LADIPGFDISNGLTLSVSDEDIFDEIPPTVVLPDAQEILDSVQFSPQTAVNMLQLVDGLLVEAAKNPGETAADLRIINLLIDSLTSFDCLLGFDVRIPLLDTSLSKVKET
jgi:hypothetical protein